MSSLEKAIILINEFCNREYGSDADTSDLSNISLAYTDASDEIEHEIQVSVDLANFTLNTYKDNVLCSRTQYDSLENLISNELEWLDFDALIRAAD